jgi:hypothetical protein
MFRKARKIRLEGIAAPPAGSATVGEADYRSGVTAVTELHVAPCDLSATHPQELLMNILLWYLPYAMFSGACDVALSQRETQTGDEWPAQPTERMRDSGKPTPAQLPA